MFHTYSQPEAPATCGAFFVGQRVAVHQLRREPQAGRIRAFVTDTQGKPGAMVQLEAPFTALVHVASIADLTNHPSERDARFLRELDRQRERNGGQWPLGMSPDVAAWHARMQAAQA